MDFLGPVALKTVALNQTHWVMCRAVWSWTVSGCPLPLAVSLPSRLVKTCLTPLFTENSGVG